MKNIITLNFFALLIIIIFLTLPFFVFGQQEVTDNQGPMSFLENIASGDDGPYSADTDTNTVMDTVALLINGVLGLLSVIFLALSIYSGIRWMTAQGNEEEVTKAKTILTQAIIGLIIVVSSWGIWGIIVNLWLSNI